MSGMVSVALLCFRLLRYYALTMVVCMCFMFVLMCALFMVLGVVLMPVGVVIFVLSVMHVVGGVLL